MNNKDYKLKLSKMESLLQEYTQRGKLSITKQKELDMISDSVADYEEANFPFKPDTLQEMIELRMYQRKLKQKDLAKLLDTTPSRISELLNGKRNLTLELAKNLYKKLNIDAELILEL